MAAQGEWRVARATALARGGSTAEAERLAREAVQLAATTDCPLARSSALLTLASVLQLGGRLDQARPAAADALAVARAKGDLATTSRALALLGRPAQPAR